MLAINTKYIYRGKKGKRGCIALFCIDMVQNVNDLRRRISKLAIHDIIDLRMHMYTRRFSPSWQLGVFKEEFLKCAKLLQLKCSI